MTCLSEDEYMARHLGPLKSPVFLPICITYLILFMVDVVGNSLTCVVILLSKVMQTPTNYYLLSLAVSDLLVLLLGMPLELYEMWQNYPFLLREGGCYFKIFLFETVCFASILNVTALSIERYMAVVHPLKVKHRTTHAHVKKVIFRALGAVSVVCCYLWDHGTSVISMLSHISTWMYNLIILISTVVFFLLPMLTISMLYLLIVLQLHREQVLKLLVRCAELLFLLVVVPRAK
uniref:G-protein coupled receptors family 1 profile domain-containing protein n=1 Tax=Mastacembelus armatus TaxID=205130 RepID=A0A3Q3L198_9TELE